MVSSLQSLLFLIFVGVPVILLWIGVIRALWRWIRRK